MAAPGKPATPANRQLILEAALQVIATHGLHKTTHRLIAQQAGLSPGSVTYHFSDLTEVLEQAFGHLVAQMSLEYHRHLEQAEDQQQACAAIVEMLCGPGYLSEQRMTLMLELYSFGNFNATVRRLCGRWLESSHSSLGLHFRPETARALDALIEGWPMHARFQRTPLDRPAVERAVGALVSAFEPGEAATTAG